MDNLFHPVDTHHFYSFGTFLFSAFCTGYIMRGVSFSSEIGWRATISSPCISIRYWSSVIAIASSAEQGYRNAPLSSLLYIRRKPSPSQSSALIRSHLLPQKRNSVFFVVRIKLKLKAYDRCQSIDPTTEIRKSHRQIHLFKPGSICIIQHG